MKSKTKFYMIFWLAGLIFNLLLAADTLSSTFLVTKLPLAKSPLTVNKVLIKELDNAIVEVAQFSNLKLSLTQELTLTTGQVDHLYHHAAQKFTHNSSRLFSSQELCQMLNSNILKHSSAADKSYWKKHRAAFKKNLKIYLAVRQQKTRVQANYAQYQKTVWLAKIVFPLSLCLLVATLIACLIKEPKLDYLCTVGCALLLAGIGILISALFWSYRVNNYILTNLDLANSAFYMYVILIIQTKWLLAVGLFVPAMICLIIDYLSDDLTKIEFKF